MDGTEIVALVGIVSTAIVGGLAAWLPHRTRRQDREHERTLRLQDRRSEAYTSVLHIMQALEQFDQKRMAELKEDAATLIWLWGTKEVRDLFEAWAGGLYEKVGPNVTDDDRERVHARATALRLCIGAEVQGKA